MDARTRAWLDQHDTRVANAVRRRGWLIDYIGGGCDVPGCECPEPDFPPFAYTVGLFGLAHPELLIFGVPPELAAGVLNALGEDVRRGRDLVPGEIVAIEEWPHRIFPEEVPNPGEIVFEANRYYRRPAEESVPVIQLSYDDTEGRFPWEEDCAEPEMQPRPGTFRA